MRWRVHVYWSVWHWSRAGSSSSRAASWGKARQRMTARPQQISPRGRCAATSCRPRYQMVFWKRLPERLVLLAIHTRRLIMWHAHSLIMFSVMHESRAASSSRAAQRAANSRRARSAAAARSRAARSRGKLRQNSRPWSRTPQRPRCYCGATCQSPQSLTWLAG